MKKTKRVKCMVLLVTILSLMTNMYAGVEAASSSTSNKASVASASSSSSAIKPFGLYLVGGKIAFTRYGSKAQLVVTTIAGQDVDYIKQTLSVYKMDSGTSTWKTMGSYVFDRYDNNYLSSILYFDAITGDKFKTTVIHTVINGIVTESTTTASNIFTFK